MRKIWYPNCKIRICKTSCNILQAVCKMCCQWAHFVPKGKFNYFSSIRCIICDKSIGLCGPHIPVLALRPGCPRHDGRPPRGTGDSGVRWLGLATSNQPGWITNERAAPQSFHMALIHKGLSAIVTLFFLFLKRLYKLISWPLPAVNCSSTARFKSQKNRCTCTRGGLGGEEVEANQRASVQLSYFHGIYSMAMTCPMVRNTCSNRSCIQRIKGFLVV